jgi:predicted LPLAT superfamily acyltransferase
MGSGRPALLGSFHIGHSDLIGFMLGDFGRRVAMIRQRVGNSGDTLGLVRHAGAWVTMIWVNDADNLLFALKDAVGSGSSVAMKCDRIGFSSKLEPFDFLGKRRLFPFTIYHLALIFRLPVVLCLGTSGGRDESLVHGSPVFEPDDGTRESNFQRARVHFQEFLLVIESLLRKDPFVWFNFIPLNPVAPESPTAAAG